MSNDNDMRMEFEYEGHSQKEMVKRFKRRIASLKNEYGHEIRGLKENWNGSTGNFSFVCRYYRVYASLIVEPSEVKFSVRNLPFMTDLGRIRHTIGAEIEALLC